MIYITYADLFHTSYFGITKKIMSQIKIFQQSWKRVYYTTRKGKMIYLMEGNRVIDKELAVTSAMCNKSIDVWLDKYKIQRTYIRYDFADRSFMNFLESQKNKNIKSVLEIPTYPYDGEITNERIRIEDEYYRKQLYRFIKCAATNTEAENIWGISCIKLLNGVDMDKCPLHMKKKIDKKIVLISVGSMAIWHGYERILEGIYNYYADGNQEYDIIFKIVGDGPEKGKYCLLTEEYGLQSRVEFCGMLEGEGLNRQYEQADIAVSSLGLYKTGIHSVTPIKGAEYCARGIPFVCGYHDMRFPEDAEYIMKVSNNSEPVDMRGIIDFYENIVLQKNLNRRMRDYATEHFTWEKMMAPIIEYLK
ncbi:glycosyltransferase [Lachnospiraceae bacterium 56-18]|uniref:glycosyltransferase n=1 Tax=Sporofaciens sp. JLR.KK001 TaxID=3112621 RepID=UPI002FF1CB47